MKYIYPKFSKYDFNLVRLGGAGLGNLLFTYTRALKLARETRCEFVWPTWRSVKVGPYLRHEKDKRFYGDLFCNNSEYIDGAKKAKLRAFSKKFTVKTAQDVQCAPDGALLIYDDFTMNFDGLLSFRNEIYADLIKNLQEKNRQALNSDFARAVNVHVRLGDFNSANNAQLQKGVNNTSLPINWYVELINIINSATDNKLTFNIFSDGTDAQLAPILEIENTKRVFFGTSIADILALSSAPLMIASGSSFSLWARYLGNCSSISYINQIKDRVYEGTDGFEIESDGTLPDDILQKIQKIYAEVL